MDQVGRPLCYSYSDGYRTISEDYRPGRLTTVLPIFYGSSKGRYSILTFKARVTIVQART